VVNLILIKSGPRVYLVHVRIGQNLTGSALIDVFAQHFPNI